MKRKQRALVVPVVLAAALSFALGCRAVLGVEELSLAEDAATTDAPTSVDAGTDADAADSASPYAECVAMGGECQKCCRDKNMSAGSELERLGQSSGCLCLPDGGGCSVECNPGVCGGGGMATGGTCGQCADPLLRTGPACAAARTSCKASPSCRALALCWEACK